MPCPFPGMDPYIERPSLWGDFHDSFIACLRGGLQPLLRPKYAAFTQDRLYVVESDPLYPDVSIVRHPQPPQGASTPVALAEPDAPAVFELWREEIRQPLLQIIEPNSGRIVTALEVLSPDNKRKGPGRESYLKKREEFWESGTNLVEIDLLREGEATVRIGADKLAGLSPWHYLVTVTRRWPSRQEVYAIPLQRRLPRVAIPLAMNDKDVVLDLQTVFNRCWNESPYPEWLRYDQPPPGPLSAEEIAWCDEILRQAGFRTAATS